MRSINNALSELVYAEQSFTTQIAEIIRRDPTLTSRLLKLVNSVFFGLSKRVTSIEDAVFYLGLKQIRELALATPVIEDFNRLKKNGLDIDWRMLWQHSIGTAIVTREIVHIAGIAVEDDIDYIAGLVHNVGQILKASVFADEFQNWFRQEHSSLSAECAAESAHIGWNHAEMGAHFLSQHQLSEEVVTAVRYHHHPEHPQANQLAAAIQIADHLVRTTEIVGIETVCRQEDADEGVDFWEKHCKHLSGWEILFGADDGSNPAAELNALLQSLQRLPKILSEIV